MHLSPGVITISLLGLLISGCAQQPKTVAQKAPGHTPSLPSIACEVTSGPNKGQQGTRTEDGWCEGDWGGTECRPRTKCKDIETSDARGSVPGQPDSGVVRGLAPGTGSAVIGIRPPNGSPRHAYCLRDGDFLSVIFANSGGLASTGAVAVDVTFKTKPPTTLTRQMPAIPSGGRVEMAFPVPSGCFTPDCDFTIQWSNQPPVAGRCF